MSIKKSLERRNSYLDYLIDPSFQGVNKFFVLSFEDDAHQIRHRIFSSESRNKTILMLWSINKFFLTNQ